MLSWVGVSVRLSWEYTGIFISIVRRRVVGVVECVMIQCLGKRR